MGPLSGLKIVELFCIGPGPFAGMLLSDMGADVLLVDRAVEPDYGYPDHPHRFLYRNRRSVRLDLKDPDSVETVLRLVEEADGLIEGFRPGVTERLGLGPDVCLARNPRLVYGRMTGWGQEGPLAQRAGFDVNFLSVTGGLWAIGDEDRPPPPPLILAGDFGGGGVFLAMGMIAAMFEASRSGQGQVVDAAIADGALNLLAYFYGNLAGGDVGQPAPRQPGRRRRLALWHVAVRRREVRVHRPAAAAVPAHHGREERARRVRSRGSERPGQLACVPRAHGRPVRHPDTGRVGRPVRRGQRHRDARPRLDRGARAPAERAAGRLRRRRGDQPTGAGTALQPDPLGDPAPVPRPGQGGAEALAEWGIDEAHLERLRGAGAFD